VNWLGLPKETSTAFIMGIVRRDFGAAGLSDMLLTPMQTVISLITITLFVPCVASIIVIFKERSKKEAVIMWISTWIIAFLVGGIVSQLARLLGGETSVNALVVAGVVWAVVGISIIGLNIYQNNISRAKPSSVSH
jgi:ferrous iron transport protein B